MWHQKQKRRQEIVIIGHRMKRNNIQGLLDECLLTDEETALGPEKRKETMEHYGAVRLETLLLEPDQRGHPGATYSCPLRLSPQPSRDRLPRRRGPGPEERPGPDAWPERPTERPTDRPTGSLERETRPELPALAPPLWSSEEDLVAASPSNKK